MLKRCTWCQQQPVKRAKHACCSPSCAAQKRWNEMDTDGRRARMIGGREAAYKNERTKRILAEATGQIEAFGIRACCGDSADDLKRIIKLYVVGRNKGYHAGYMAATKRARNRPI